MYGSTNIGLMQSDVSVVDSVVGLNHVGPYLVFSLTSAITWVRDNCIKISTHNQIMHVCLQLYTDSIRKLCSTLGNRHVSEMF
jgi:hypothetical protein